MYINIMCIYKSIKKDLNFRGNFFAKIWKMYKDIHYSVNNSENKMKMPKMSSTYVYKSHNLQQNIMQPLPLCF